MDTKQLNRITVCNLFEINAPIWGGGEKKVGLNKARIGFHNEIRFKYRRKSDGELSIPDVYYFDGSDVSKYETQQIKGVTLVLVPFSELQYLERV